MGKKMALLLAAFGVAAAISSGFVVGGIQAYSRFQQNSLASQQHCGGQAPVHICVQAPLELFSAYYPFYLATHTQPFFVTYSSDSPVTLLISASIVGFSQLEMHTVSATGVIQSQGFIPAPLASAVLKQVADTHTSLSVRVTDTRGNLYYSNDSALLLHSHRLMQWVAANRLKIAAWVTPDDAAVKALVTKSLKYLADEPAPAPPAMIGYANHASARAVRDQVDALFDAMRLDYHIRYTQESVPYGGPGDTSVSLENINLPQETLQQHRGMCIELTVLLASAVEEIGLRAEIVIIPGHAFLGVATTPDQGPAKPAAQYEYWDAVEVNANVAGDSANIATDQAYMGDVNSHQIIDTIVISDARLAGVDPMV
jgi:Transglutaminase-like superfamily